MRKLFGCLAMLLIGCSAVYAGPDIFYGKHDGSNGEVYECAVATTAYCVYLSTTADVSVVVSFKNNGTETAYWNYTTTVSTGQSASGTITTRPNGFRTGKNGTLNVGQTNYYDGKMGSVVYFKGSSASGTLIEVDVRRR